MGTLMGCRDRPTHNIGILMLVSHKVLKYYIYHIFVIVLGVQEFFTMLVIIHH